ncbi:hypothetical protein HKD37_17G048897 [Glycine soja]
MSSINQIVSAIVHYDAYVAYCNVGIEFKSEKNVLVSMKKGMTFNALKRKFQQKICLNRDYCVTAPQLLNLNKTSNLNAQPTTQIHVSQSQSNEMSHDHHAENGLPNEVVGEFNDNEDEILAVNNNNNINDNDDNDIQFLFQSITTKNVYCPYSNYANVGENQVTENPNYRHFWDLPQ